LQVITAIEGQFDDLFLVDDIPHGGVFCCNERRGGAYRDLFGETSYFEDNVQPRLLAGFQDNAGTNYSVEARILDGQCVLARSELRDRVFSIIVGEHASAFVGPRIGNCNVRARQDRSRVICDPPHDSSPYSLSRENRS